MYTEICCLGQCHVQCQKTFPITTCSYKSNCIYRIHLASYRSVLETVLLRRARRQNGNSRQKEVLPFRWTHFEHCNYIALWRLRHWCKQKSERYWRLDIFPKIAYRDRYEWQDPGRLDWIAIYSHSTTGDTCVKSCFEAFSINMRIARSISPWLHYIWYKLSEVHESDSEDIKWRSGDERPNIKAGRCPQSRNCYN